MGGGASAAEPAVPAHQMVSCSVGRPRGGASCDACCSCPLTWPPSLPICRRTALPPLQELEPPRCAHPTGRPCSQSTCSRSRQRPPARCAVPAPPSRRCRQGRRLRLSMWRVTAGTPSSLARWPARRHSPFSLSLVCTQAATPLPLPPGSPQRAVNQDLPAARHPGISEAGLAQSLGQVGRQRAHAAAAAAPGLCLPLSWPFAARSLPKAGSCCY